MRGPWLSMGPGRRLLAAGGAICALFLLACGGDSRPGEAGEARSWVWVPEDEELSRADARRLEAGGFGEFVVVMGRLRAASRDASGAAGTGRLESLAPGRLPARSRAVLALAVDSDWTGGGPEQVEEVLRFAARRRLDLEASGVIPVGLHLEVGPGAPREEGLRPLIERAQRDGAWNSVTLGVSRQALAGDVGVWRNVALAADAVIAPVYGQRVLEVDDASAWDLRQADDRRETLARLRMPFRTVLEVSGAAQRGKETPVGAGLSLAALARDPRLRLDTGFSLAGVDRRVYRFVARESVAGDGLRLARGESLLVRLPLESALRSLVEARTRAGNVRWIGFVWRPWSGVPADGERPSLGFGASEWERVFGADASAPIPLQVQIVEAGVSRRAGERVVRLRLRNPSTLGSEIAVFESNFVLVTADGGFFAEVATGDFQRFDFVRPGDDRVSVEALRRPQRLRLFAAAIGPGETLESGPIGIRGAGARLELRATAHFALPDGGAGSSPGGGEFAAVEARWPPS